MIKTAVENNQNLVVEGCYIPFNWKADFSEEYLEHIYYYCLVMAKKYIENHFADIKGYENVIEGRLYDSFLSQEILIKENDFNLEACKKYRCDYILINDEYKVDVEL